MLKKHILKKLNAVSEEVIQNEKELIASYEPYNKREQNAIKCIAKKYKGFLRAEEVAYILDIAASTVYRDQELCPTRDVGVDSNRKYFLPHSVIILAREKEKTVCLRRVNR